MKRFKILQALKGRIFTGYITKKDGSVRNVWGQCSDTYIDQKAKQVDLNNDQIRFFDYTINPETNKPNGFRIMKLAENDFSIKSGNTTIEQKDKKTYIYPDGRFTLYDWRSV